MDQEIYSENTQPQEETHPQEETAPAGKEEEKASFRMDLYFWTQALVMALVFLILAFTLLGRVIGVVGSSMVPTLHENDLLLLQSAFYTPKQGDVVVLQKPGFPPDGTAPIVKRVIAVGGQHVEVDYSRNAVLVDGQALDEPYIAEAMVNRFGENMSVVDVTVPEGSIYVMGDNRNRSSDSRHVALGTVDNRYVLGRVLCVIFPFQDFGAVH